MCGRVMVGISGVEEELAIAMPCAARHEAGHLAIAGANGLRLRADALALDDRANGLGLYFKEPDGREPWPERVCLALYAGYFGERRFRDAHAYPYIPPDQYFLGSDDGKELNPLLFQIPAERLTNGDATTTGLRLRRESELLVERHWRAIEELSATLLAKTWQPLKALNSGVLWSRAAVAKYLSGVEAVEILARHGIAASCGGDS